MSRANEPMYPTLPLMVGDSHVPATRGLSIREHVATTLLPVVYTQWRAHLTVEQIAAEAARYADALIAELSKEIVTGEKPGVGK